jgi:predicted deacylase
MAIIEINGIRAEAGDKAYGFLEVGKTSFNTYRIPIAIINGAMEGKILGILGGIHGTEFASIEAVIRIIQYLNPKKMWGTVLAIPVVNGPQFEHRRAFLNPFDLLNQNRTFPGKSDGTLSLRTSQIVFDKVVSKCSALIDCHGGDITEDIDCMAIAGKGNNEEINQVANDMASCFPTKYITHFHVEESGLSMFAQKKFSIPTVTSEAGTPYPIRERHVNFHYIGIINNMKYFGILEGKPILSNPVNDPKRYRFTADQGGIWHSKVELGQKVKAGQEIGNMTDLFGNIIKTYIAPETATINFLRVFYSVNCGEPLVGLVVLN